MIYATHLPDGLVLRGLIFDQAEKFALIYTPEQRRHYGRRIEEHIESGAFPGVVDARSPVAEPERVAHDVINMRWVGDNVEVYARVLETPAGQALRRYVGTRTELPELIFGCVFGPGTSATDGGLAVPADAVLTQVSIEVQPSQQGPTDLSAAVARAVGPADGRHREIEVREPIELTDEETVHEDEDDRGNVVRRTTWKCTASGVVARADVRTALGNCYPAAVLRRAVADHQVLIETGRAFGVTRDAAAAPELVGGALSLRDVTHTVRALTMDETGAVWAKVELTPTPGGTALRTLLRASRAESPALLQMRMTGMGSVDAQGRVGSDYVLVSVDFVLDPVPSISSKVRVP